MTSAETGPTFAERLDAALRASPLSARQVTRRLDEMGVPTTPALLSYWRRGARRPGREQSVRVVGALEVVLGLAPGELAGETRLEPRSAGLAALDVTRVAIDDDGWSWSRSIVVSTDGPGLLTVVLEVVPLAGMAIGGIEVLRTSCRAVDLQHEDHRLWVRAHPGAGTTGAVTIDLGHPRVLGRVAGHVTTVVGPGVLGALVVERRHDGGRVVSQDTVGGSDRPTRLVLPA